MESEVREAVPGLPSTSELASYVRSPAALLDRLGADLPSDQEGPSGADVEGNPPAMVRPETEQGAQSAAAVESDAVRIWPDGQSRLVGDATWN